MVFSHLPGLHVLVTGANGFIGRALARRLAADGQMGGRVVDRLTLLDLGFGSPDPEPLPGPEPAAQPVVHRLAGDLGDAAWLRSALQGEAIDVVFHLASIPGGTAEQHYDLARRVNVDATTVLLELGKAQAERRAAGGLGAVGPGAGAHAGPGAPTFVFASSIAVFGALDALGAPVDDHTLPNPQLTYGTHKLIGEALVADFSRRGWVNGRSLRLPGVLARPPAPTGQLSAFMSDIIHALAAGRAFVCPTSAQATTWASSLPCVVNNLLHAAAVPSSRLNGRCTFTLPTLHFSMADLVDAIAQVHGTDARALVRFAPDERIERLFGRYPPLHTPAALAAGLAHDGRPVDLVARAQADSGATPARSPPCPP